MGLGQRQIARSCGIGLSTVHEYLERASAAGIGWPLPEGLREEELEAKLFGNPPVPARAVQPRPQPDWKAVHEQRQAASQQLEAWLQAHIHALEFFGGVPTLGCRITTTAQRPYRALRLLED